MKKKQLKLPTNLLSSLSESINDKEWRDSHNFSKKRKSRKELRKEQRQAKKHKPNQPSEKIEKPKVKPEKPKKTPVKKKEEIVLPFVSKHEEELRQKDEEDAKYYAKKLGMKGLKLKDENDGLGDILGDLDFDDFGGLGADEESNDSNDSNDDFGDPYSDNSDENEEELTAEETMKKLAALKGKKAKSGDEIRVVKEDELEDDSLSDFGDSDLESDSNDMTPEETMRKLASLKSKGKGNTNDHIRVVKEDDLEDDSVSDFDEGSDMESDETPEETMKKLAKLKGKGNADENIRILKEDELDDDSLSDFSGEESEAESDSESESEMTAEDTMKKLAALKKNKESKDNIRVVKEDDLEDDSLSDFDGSDVSESNASESDNNELTAEETMKKLAALKNKKSNSSVRVVKEDELEDDSMSDFESDSQSDSDSDSDENPYVPPTRKGAPQHATEIKRDSEEVQKMRRAIKGALNKLTESTLPHVSQEIQLTFVKNSRAEASEIFTEELLNLVNTPQPLQQVLYTVYSGLCTHLYQSIGVSFAAYFVQTLVELVFNTDGSLKESPNNSNLMNLLVELYTFHIVSSRLMYDIMKELLKHIETTESLSEVELLLVIIRSGGSQLRSDDPHSLKEVIILLQRKMQDIGGEKSLTPRMKFLVDAIVALKNNRQKPLSELVVSSRHRIRKALQSSNGGGSLKEPMQVGISDILESQTRGKWWLVGASWKGNKSNSQDEEKFDFDLDDEFGQAAIDWLELAKKQRLNTDIRRAVFVALMGAEDYLDACLRIDKLSLKNKQERDIPHVILHCLLQEQVYNPFYMLVASKQCTRHSTMKTFQFRLWDWLNSDPQGQTQQALHFGRFFANLVSHKAMSLDVLKKADFLGGSSDTQLFLDMFFVTLYKDLAKVAEKDAKTQATRGLANIYKDKSEEKRDGKELALMLKKIQEPTVLRGMQIVNKRINKSDILRSDKEKERVRWASRFTDDLIHELVKE